MKTKAKIGIIGFGNMGKAIAQRLRTNYIIYIFDNDENKLRDTSGFEISRNAANIMTQADAIILAVKPQDFSILLDEIKDFAKDKLIISIAAGITTFYIENYIEKVKVVRVMPNMPAKIGKGMSCMCKGKFAANDSLCFVDELFKHLGKTLILKENMMDAATAISGSGPGYFYDFIEFEGAKAKDFENSLKKAAKSIGFSEEESISLAKATTNGSIQMLKAEDNTPQELKTQITSKGGTTEAGLDVLHKGGTLLEAVKAALERAKQLTQRSQ